MASHFHEVAVQKLVHSCGIGSHGRVEQVPLGTQGGVGHCVITSNGERLVKLSIWDLAGQERFGVVRSGFYRGSRAAALVYDVTSLTSLGNLKRWRDEMLETAPNQPFVVVGNKVDLERRVRPELARAAAEYLGAPYLETSALSGEGVAALFQALAVMAAKPR